MQTYSDDSESQSVIQPMICDETIINKQQMNKAKISRFKNKFPNEYVIVHSLIVSGLSLKSGYDFFSIVPQLKSTQNSAIYSLMISLVESYFIITSVLALILSLY